MKRSTCFNAKIHKQNDLTYCTHCVSIIGEHQIKTDSKLMYIVALLFLTLFMFVHANAPHSENSILRYSVYKIENVIIPDVALNDSSIVEELVNQGCIQIPSAIAQFHVETRELNYKGMPVPYTSDVCLTDKNIAGIRFKVKGSKAIGQTKDNLHYLIYASYKDCISDYIKIQNGYLKAINGHYAENNNYVSMLKKVK